MDGEPDDSLRRELLLHYEEIRDELCRVVRCPHRGADLAQETYCRALAALGRRSRPRDVRAWLRAVARNVVRDHYRRSPGWLEPCDAELLVDQHETASIADREEEERDARSVAEAVAALPPLTRALIVGFYFERKGCEALGNELGIRRGNVKVRLHRARKKLRKQLGHNEEVPRD